MILMFLSEYRYKTKSLHQKGAIFEIANIYTSRPYGLGILSVVEATTVALINSSRGKQGNPPPSERNLPIMDIDCLNPHVSRNVHG